VASEAVFVLELGLGMSRTGPGKQTYDERLSEEFSGGVHDYEKMLLEGEPAVTGITPQKGTK
jgi:hypothetical protein